MSRCKYVAAVLHAQLLDVLWFYDPTPCQRAVLRRLFGAETLDGIAMMQTGPTAV